MGAGGGGHAHVSQPGDWRATGPWEIWTLLSSLPSFSGGAESLPDLVSVSYCLPRVVRADLNFLPLLNLPQG